MPASIADVAAVAGVSVATVSRALRGLPNVAPSTRDRVLAAAEQLRYVADPHASRLASGRTRTVGVAVPVISQWFFSTVVAGVEGVLAAAGFDLLLYTVGGTPGRSRFLARMPFRKRVDGLVLIDLPFDADEQAAVAEQGTPTVMVGVASDRFPTVAVDNRGGAASATRHLLNLGHDRIGLIANLRDDPLRSPAPVDRRAGYRDALTAAGVDVRADLDVPGNFSVAGGAEAMAQLLSRPDPPSAVFAESDEMAIGAMRTLRDAGLAVPGDVSVIGFDDHDLAAYVGLSTVAQPVMAMGEVAADLLLTLLAEPDAPARHDVMPTKVVVRSTTGPAPAPRRRDGRRVVGRSL